MKALALVLLALVPACAAQVDNTPERPAPSCSPGSIDIAMLLTPEAVTSVDEQLASEFGVTGCVEVENPGYYDPERLQHLWCCWKDEVSP